MYPLDLGFSLALGRLQQQGPCQEQDARDTDKQVFLNLTWNLGIWQYRGVTTGAIDTGLQTLRETKEHGPPASKRLVGCKNAAYGIQRL